MCHPSLVEAFAALLSQLLLYRISTPVAVEERPRETCHSISCWETRSTNWRRGVHFVTLLQDAADDLVHYFIHFRLGVSFLESLHLFFNVFLNISFVVFGIDFNARDQLEHAGDVVLGSTRDEELHNTMVPRFAYEVIQMVYQSDELLVNHFVQSIKNNESRRVQLDRLQKLLVTSSKAELRALIYALRPGFPEALSDPFAIRYGGGKLTHNTSKDREGHAPVRFVPFAEEEREPFCRGFSCLLDVFDQGRGQECLASASYMAT